MFTLLVPNFEGSLEGSDIQAPQKTKTPQTPSCSLRLAPASRPNSGRNCCHQSNLLPQGVFVKHVKTKGLRAQKCASM